MNNERSIPIVIGVSGHRLLNAEDRDALYEAVTGELKKLQARCPDSPLVMLTSLAEGGDMLCADAAEALGIPLLAALPMEPEIFAGDFPPEARARFDAHCKRAETVFVTPFTETPPAEIDDDFRYRQNGIYVAAHSHVLLALWDGGPARENGCGTAEAVDFALRGAYRPAEGVALRAEGGGAVMHIFTPRGARRGRAGEVRLLGDPRAFEDVLAKTDEFNGLAARGKAAGAALFPETEMEDPVLTRLERVYHAADASSVSFASQYRRVLALLAAASTVIAAAFLVYDDLTISWLLLVCGAMLAVAWVCRRFAVRSDCHRRYIEYRALAEGLRVQAFLRYAGSGLLAADLLSWTQREETTWILKALDALTTGEAPRTKHAIGECWIEAQREYHKNALKKTRRELTRSDRIVNAALLLSVALYIAALVFELAFGGLIFPPAAVPGEIDLWRIGLSLALGTISAGTVFIANYHGKLSLPRKLSDHAKMERFFGEMLVRLALHGQTDALLRVLAREELVENGNWCSYQRDNTPDISL